MTDTAKPLAALITASPVPHDPARAASERSDLLAIANETPDLANLSAILAAPKVSALLDGVFGCSPYLTALIRKRPHALLAALTSPPTLTSRTSTKS